MIFSADSLRAVLALHTPNRATGFLVALSGGADSACLLTALCPPGRPLWRNLPVRAVHVDHGLQSAAAAFRDACEALCRRLEVPLTVVAAVVETGAGVSLEAAARDARYAALALQMRDGECLLTAHHAQDQAETVLLQLLRGAGLKGLAAMPPCRSWQRGWHLRPLLDVTRQDLERYAGAWGVTAVNDPMNADQRFDRVYLRTSLWPLVEARWPGAARALARTARHVGEAQALLDQAAAASVDQLRDGAALSVPALRALSAAEQRNALRYWILQQSVPPPSARRLAEALRQIVAANDDHLPAVLWGDHALRRYRNRLFLTPAMPPCVDERGEWATAAAATHLLARGLGTLQWSSQSGGLDAARLPAMLVVRRRRGGESLKPQRYARTQTLQHLCQSLGVLPWMRNALPLLYAGDELIAVGDLWQDARWCVAAGAPGLGCVWRAAPTLV